MSRAKIASHGERFVRAVGFLNFGFWISHFGLSGGAHMARLSISAEAIADYQLCLGLWTLD